jgi:hypothetical protein
MQTWEYLFVEENTHDRKLIANGRLSEHSSSRPWEGGNVWGAEGWELIAAGKSAKGWEFIFKRPTQT